MNNKIKVAMCDDMIDIQNYFRTIIEREDDMEFIGSASSAKEGIELVRRTRPDVVLMDIQMENGEAGIGATELIKAEMPEIKVIIITIHENDELLFKAYVAGAIDYIVKTVPAEHIVNSIRNVHKNKIMLRPEVAEKIVDEFSRLKKREDSLLYMLNIATTLTNAELDILKSLAEGKSRKQIALERFVEQNTINKQITSILKKYNYNSTKLLIRNLSQIGIFEILKSKKSK